MSLYLMFAFRLVVIVSVIFWIWALVDCLLRPEESYEKTFGTINSKPIWVVIVLFGQIIGAIIYYFVAGTRKNPKRASVKVDSAGTEEGKRILQMIAGGKISPEEGQRLLVALGEKDNKRTKAQPIPIAVKIIVIVEIAIMVASAMIGVSEAILSTSLMKGLLVFFCGMVVALCLFIGRNHIMKRIVSPETPYTSLSTDMKYFHIANYIFYAIALFTGFALALIIALREKGLM